MAKCKKCDGKGATRYKRNSEKEEGCYWFKKYARTCESCDGTGEKD